MKTYGQFCGLTRAVELLGERWTLLIVRDLLVSPRRFNELRHGNPGIPSALLTARLKELEEHGVVERTLDGRAVAYRLTPYGHDLGPILNALGLWGARRMATPRDGEAPTDSSLAAALLSSRTDAPVDPFTVAVTAGPAHAHARVLRRGVEAHPGELADADLHLGGIALRQVLADGDAHAAIAAGTLEVGGDVTLVHRFTAAFRAPLDPRTP